LSLVLQVRHTAARSCKYHGDLAGCLRERPTLRTGLYEVSHRRERLGFFEKKHFKSVNTFQLSRSYLKTNAPVREHSSLMTWILLHRGCMTLRLPDVLLQGFFPACRTEEHQIGNQVVTSMFLRLCLKNFYIERSRIAEAKKELLLVRRKWKKNHS
jgi:hypothetical protein